MTLEKMKSDLAGFKQSLQTLNNELEGLEKKKKELLTTAIRIEGAISYLTTKIVEGEAADDPRR